MRPPVSDETEVVERVRFAAGPLTLEGRLSYPERTTPTAAVVIAGPHPLLGGDLDNNVVRGLGVGLARRGYATLAFNFRGVGGSEGTPPDVTRHLAEFWATSHVSDEPEYAEDLVAAVKAMEGFVRGQLPLTLVGYSFGCSILPLARPTVGASLVLIAPTIGTHDYTAFADVTGPLLVIAPDGDFAADAARLSEWFESLVAPKQIARGGWDDHFFRGFEEDLVEHVVDFMASQMQEITCS